MRIDCKTMESLDMLTIEDRDESPCHIILVVGSMRQRQPFILESCWCTADNILCCFLHQPEGKGNEDFSISLLLSML